jgi:hypothetical protein
MSYLILDRSANQSPAPMNWFEPVPNQSLVQCEPVQVVQFTNLNRFIIEPLTSLTGVLKHTREAYDICSNHSDSSNSRGLVIKVVQTVTVGDLEIM